MLATARPSGAADHGPAVQLPRGAYEDEEAVQARNVAKRGKAVKPSNLNTLRVGDYIEVPGWDLSGRTIEVRPSVMGRHEAVIVLIQEYPEQPLNRCQRYRLEPGQWRLADA